MAFIVNNPVIGTQPLAATSTVKNHPLGTIVTAADSTYGAGEFVYLQGIGSTVVGSVVTWDSDTSITALAVAGGIGPLACSMSINVASSYGWYQVQGKGVAKVLAAFADNGNCYLTATAGSVDDAIVAGDYITGMKGASAIDTPSTGLAEVELSRPFVRDGLDV